MRKKKKTARLILNAVAVALLFGALGTLRREAALPATRSSSKGAAQLEVEISCHREGEEGIGGGRGGQDELDGSGKSDARRQHRRCHRAHDLFAQRWTEVVPGPANALAGAAEDGLSVKQGNASECSSQLRRAVGAKRPTRSGGAGFCRSHFDRAPNRGEMRIQLITKRSAETADSGFTFHLEESRCDSRPASNGPVSRGLARCLVLSAGGEQPFAPFVFRFDVAWPLESRCRRFVLGKSLAARRGVPGMKIHAGTSKGDLNDKADNADSGSGRGRERTAGSDPQVPLCGVKGVKWQEDPDCALLRWQDGAPDPCRSMGSEPLGLRSLESRVQTRGRVISAISIIGISALAENEHRPGKAALPREGNGAPQRDADGAALPKPSGGAPTRGKGPGVNDGSTCGRVLC
ncbi:unnamed protein product [Lampetra planeri]